MGFNSKFPLFFYGWSGVDLFFILSGFLIGKQLWKELRDAGTINIPRFLLRRGLRIWPYYYAFILFSIAISTTPIQSFFPDMLFLSNYLHHQIGGGWSLSTEEQFYIIIPVLLLLGTKFIPLKFGFIIPAVLFILLPIGRYTILSSHTGVITDAIRDRLTYFYIHTHSDGLILGLLIAWIYTVKNKFMQKLPLKKNIVIPIGLICIGIVLRIANNFIFAFTSLALIFGAMAIFMLRDNSKLTTIFRWKGFYLMSRLSYGMYLSHFTILIWILPLFLMLPYSHTQIGFWMGYILVIVITSVISWITFLIIESPFLQLREYLYNKKITLLQQN